MTLREVGRVGLIVLALSGHIAQSPQKKEDVETADQIGNAWLQKALELLPDTPQKIKSLKSSIQVAIDTNSSTNSHMLGTATHAVNNLASAAIRGVLRAMNEAQVGSNVKKFISQALLTKYQYNTITKLQAFTTIRNTYTPIQKMPTPPSQTSTHSSSPNLDAAFENAFAEIIDPAPHAAPAPRVPANPADSPSPVPENPAPHATQDATPDPGTGDTPAPAPAAGRTRRALKSTVANSFADVGDGGSEPAPAPAPHASPAPAAAPNQQPAAVPNPTTVDPLGIGHPLGTPIQVTGAELDALGTGLGGAPSRAGSSSSLLETPVDVFTSLPADLGNASANPAPAATSGSPATSGDVSVVTIDTGSPQASSAVKRGSLISRAWKALLPKKTTEEPSQAPTQAPQGKSGGLLSGLFTRKAAAQPRHAEEIKNEAPSTDIPLASAPSATAKPASRRIAYTQNPLVRGKPATNPLAFAKTFKPGGPARASTRAAASISRNPSEGLTASLRKATAATVVRGTGLAPSVVPPPEDETDKIKFVEQHQVATPIASSGRDSRGPLPVAAALPAPMPPVENILSPEEANSEGINPLFTAFQKNPSLRETIKAKMVPAPTLAPDPEPAAIPAKSGNPRAAFETVEADGTIVTRIWKGKAPTSLDEARERASELAGVLWPAASAAAPSPLKAGAATLTPLMIPASPAASSLADASSSAASSPAASPVPLPASAEMAKESAEAQQTRFNNLGSLFVKTIKKNQTPQENTASPSPLVENDEALPEPTKTQIKALMSGSLAEADSKAMQAYNLVANAGLGAKQRRKNAKVTLFAIKSDAQLQKHHGLVQSSIEELDSAAQTISKTATNESVKKALLGSLAAKRKKLTDNAAKIEAKLKAHGSKIPTKSAARNH